VATYVNARYEGWRTGSRGSQAYVLFVLVGAVAITAVLAATTEVVPFSLWYVWLIVGVLVLRFWPLTVLCLVILVAGCWMTLREHDTTAARAVALFALVISEILILWQSSHQRSGLPVTLSEVMLANLRDRLQSYSRMPPLPEGWRSHGAALSAHGAGYAGDFLVADLRKGRFLEVVLVDVCGKGVAVGPQALQFAGALGGLMGAVRPDALMRAANTFLMREASDETFATAVHLLVDLETGDYELTSAGHPPALHWRPDPGGWMVDNSRGLALGVLSDAEYTPTEGNLGPGEALMFYTDGVVESRGRDLGEGIEWLRDKALLAVEQGFHGAPRRILRDVPRGEDDRSILILQRGPFVDQPPRRSRMGVRARRA
jgi:hypothetical protein